MQVSKVFTMVIASSIDRARETTRAVAVYFTIYTESFVSTGLYTWGATS
jgi:hypothetical protein